MLPSENVLWISLRKTKSAMVIAEFTECYRKKISPFQKMSYTSLYMSYIVIYMSRSTSYNI